ncbi:LysR family transcriptional regulator [Halalkalibacterium halodurans]|uniref:LysR family transcriptional regulator n=1 Tax=Halalkalibacterium halodurans TaxID=86665 RepID=UPI002AAA2DA8|nr:LysR family transcriptional regulator [Halalkalibacterium halodurans]MDY7224432.1 LysR family transcriptional regulator [Halalkalibacterium halodurans]MDY7243717.1 LysR family transcriptional regulator [Halalkalibacterium halodurans]MED4079637.1 LysR family transcriptional regulator [Halalkalibacterium halodurans]MED4084086.1 LysR family transcriptional regulator [Halalkalibacterium halodurans]MED4104564.1 LysR family transcriptional regulator [Halalkalibacterium halodurans]
MRMQDWEMLSTLYDTTNITKAAQRLFLSQPTITSRLQKLESYYGVQLIIRKQRGITFTPEGEKLALHAKKMLLEQRKIEEQLHNMSEEVSGSIRVGVSNFFALNKMPKLLRLFKQTYPNVEFQVVTGWSSEMHRLILNHDVHIAFIKGDYLWNETKHLLYEEEICIAAPWEFTWEDLPTLPRIDYHTDEKMRSIVDQWWYNQYKQKPNVTIQVNQVETCKEMVIHGLGYAIIANLVVRPYPELIIKPLHHPSGKPITRKTWMYYHNDMLQLNIVKAFVQFIQSIDVKAL